VAVTAPAAFAFTAEALPQRHAEAAGLLGAGGNLSEAFTALMSDVGAPASLRTLGYDDGDLPMLVEGALQQERLLVCAPRTPAPADLRRILAESL
jgi:alcohol dehydrogenase class IV